MKRILTVVLSALMVVALATTAFAATRHGAHGNRQRHGEDRRRTGHRLCFLGVRTENALKDRKAENTETMTKVLDALKKAGVDEKDIQTSSLSMYTTIPGTTRVTAR